MGASQLGISASVCHDRRDERDTVADSKQIETVLLDEYEVGRLIGDLCRSINHE